MTGRVFLIGRFQLLVQYKNERTAFWQLNFIGDTGVEGGMVSPVCTRDKHNICFISPAIAC